MDCGGTLRGGWRGGGRGRDWVWGGGSGLGMNSFDLFKFEKKREKRSEIAAWFEEGCSWYGSEGRQGRREGRQRGQKLTVDGAAAAGRVGVAEVARGGAGCETPGCHAAVVA